MANSPSRHSTGYLISDKGYDPLPQQSSLRLSVLERRILRPRGQAVSQADLGALDLVGIGEGLRAVL